MNPNHHIKTLSRKKTEQKNRGIKYNTVVFIRDGFGDLEMFIVEYTAQIKAKC